MTAEKAMSKACHHEEEKKVTNKVEKLSEWPRLLCFELPEYQKIKNDGSFQFKKGTYISEYGQEWTVEGEWWNGQPHGVCIVESDFARGVTTFTQGKEHGGPSWCQIRESGKRVSLEYLHYGECQGIQRAYNEDKSEM